jgi:putative transposase
LHGLENGDSRPKRVRTPQWRRQQEQAVLHLRQHFKTWGKRKIWKVSNRGQGMILSEITVGRILSKFVRLNRVKPVAFYYGHVRPKRRRVFKHHAKRWKWGMKAKRAGELIQLDHMSVGFTEGFPVEEFKATCPITGMTFMRAYTRATSRNPKRFLQYLINRAPFTIHPIQVDGGSKLRDEFETACEALNISLFVLPPKSPKYNGCEETANGATRYGFYTFYEGVLTIESINVGLDDFQSHYNECQPHDSLDLATPLENYENLLKVAC